MVDYYLDQNAYDALLRAGISYLTLSEILREQKTRIILSEHNIQETVSCWKSGQTEKIQFGQTLIKFQLAIQPVRFILPTAQLLRFEIAPIIRNTVPGPFLNPASELQIRRYLLEFAKGELTNEGRENLEKRWRDKVSERDYYEELRQQRVGKALTCADDFETFMFQNRRIVQSLAGLIVYRHLTEMGEKGRRKTAKMASSRLSKFPALRTAVRANMFLIHRLILGKKSRHDRWDDLCHCISAVYSNVFVTGDRDLLDCFSLVNSRTSVLSVAEFAEQFGVCLRRTT